MAKTIANRLKLVLGSLISPSQGAFLSECVIFDNIYIAQEIVHAIKHRKQGKQGWVGLKLDMENAFDRVEWTFLTAILNRFHFPSKFTNLIHQCVSSVTIHFSINGQISDQIFPSRGIRQGDPLSPYLFLLCSEGLTVALGIQERLGSFRGISIARIAPEISHLLFADDTFLFTTASTASCNALKEALTLYNLASGQIVNYTKSSIIFSPNTPPSLSAYFFDTLGLEPKPFIIKSLVHHNQVMIAKQAWHVFSKPNSLLATVLKAKYFKHTGFLEAGLGHSPSFTWSSLLWERDLLKKRLMWKPPSNKVNFFIDENGLWNRAKLAHYFDDPIVSSILQVPIGGLQKDDLLIWNQDSSGIFSIKSAYHLANNASLPPSSSNPSFIKNCPSEIVTHALLDCSSSAKIWKASPLRNFYSSHRHTGIKELLLSSFLQLNKENLSLLLSTVWAIWNFRNKKLFANSSLAPVDVVAWINSFLSDYREAQHSVKKYNMSKAPHCLSKPKQVSPGFYQLNTDAALSSDQGKPSFGVLGFMP
ncbi:hypothetical protein CsatA_009561 [Cannabis sativa]